ncbi:MAG: hypothetical protein HZA50_09370 [Planctomycetes bacterium]|nr:hypothetical protein [Planctomycetota bacterium]
MTQTANLPIDNVKPAPPPPQRRWWLKILLVVAIFLSGAVAGGGLTVLYIVKRVKYAIAHPQDAPVKLADRLKQKLDLSDEQTAKAQSIIAERQAALQDIRRQAQPQIDEQIALLRTQVKQVLNETQAAQWDILLDDLIKNWLPRLPETAPANAPATRPAAP